MRNLGRGLIMGGSVLFVAASGCTVITDVDRSKIQDDTGISGSAGSPDAPETGGSVSAGSGGTGGAEGGAAGGAGVPPAAGGTGTAGSAGSPGGEGGVADSPGGEGGLAGSPGGEGGLAGSPGGEGGLAGSPGGEGGAAGSPGGEGGAAGSPGGEGGAAGSPGGEGGIAGSPAGAGGGAGAPAGAGGIAGGGTAGQAGGGGACADTLCGSECVDLQTNANHCGECNYLCAATNATSTSCSSGTCAPSCEANYGNCNTPTPPDLDDGCETSFTDPATCGTTCGNIRACSTTHVNGDPTCSTTGLCDTTSCDVGWANCTQPTAPSADDGCETNILSQTTTCGGCDRACNPLNVAAMQCTDGLCTSQCAPGYGNCNQPVAPAADDGCETDLNTAVNDCGTCGHACTLTNASDRDCVGGLCEPTCSGSYLDCNTPTYPAVDDGCETNGDSVDSCGTDCGNVKVCSTANVTTRSCTSGECSPTCADGYLDCSADEHADNDGCETPNATATSCGTACGSLFECDTTNASAGATCSAGICHPICDTGFLDCNAEQDSAGDGCEVPNNTVASCGSDCNSIHACDATNTHSVTCVSGQCDLTCTAGYLDCSADEDLDLDGCETNVAALYWDETQCGTDCDDVTACDTGGGEMCLQGSCETGAIVVGSGQTYTTIQDAIDSVADGGSATIVVEADTYTEDLSIINKAITLLSDDGPGSATIVGMQKSNASEWPLARPNIDIQADSVVLDGFVIESPTLACDEYSSGIVLTGRDIEIMNNTFLVGTADGSQGIQTYKDDNAPVGLRDITGLSIHDNTFTDNGDCGGAALNAYEGIYLNTQSDPISTMADAVEIQDNTFDGLLFRALTTEREWVLFSGNTVASSLAQVTDEVYPAGVNAQADNVAISDNALNGLECAVRIGTLASLSGDGSIYMHGNCITGNDVAVRFDGTDNGYTVDATGNWWGSAAAPSTCDGPPSTLLNCAFAEFVTTGWLSSAPAICP